MKNTKLTTLAVFLGLFIFSILLIYLNAFSQVRSTITDGLYQDKPLLENIIIVEIDDESINNIGRWPWDRDVFAQLLSKVENARGIGMDLSFFEPSDNDTALINQLATMNNVVLSAEVNQGELYTPLFDTDSGYVNLRTSTDGITREITYGLHEQSIPFAFRIYQKGWNPDAEFKEEKYIINFAGKPYSFFSYSALEVLNSDIDFKDKFVLIGATAPDLHDNYFVPTSDGIPMAGVEIHAHVLQNLILDNFLKHQGRLSISILVLIIGALSMFGLSKLKVYYVIPIGIAGLIAYGLVAIWVFGKFNYVLDIFWVPLTIIIYTGTGVGLNYLAAQEHNKFIRGAFGKYISKDLLEEIISQRHELKLGGVRRDITIFFSDIRGFTTISEQLSPEKLVHLLNDYLTEMTHIIIDEKGAVDKFIGDAIMALWNAPLEQENHATLACSASIKQIKKVRELQKKWKSEGYPAMEIGCGLNTGPAIIGIMGSEDRFDYTAMGDSVNLAARLEGLTKIYGVDIIISENTQKLVKDKFSTRKLDLVKVKGKDKPVIIYELCVDVDEKFNKQYEKALELYLAAKFKEAKKEFSEAGKHKSCDLFIKRCEEYIKKAPPKDWGGAYVMKTK